MARGGVGVRAYVSNVSSIRSIEIVVSRGGLGTLNTGHEICGSAERDFFLVRSSYRVVLWA